METIGKYEVLGKVGSGGFGIVYKGRDPFIKRYVAIKTCSSEDEDIRSRFFREAEIAGNLHHRNVTTVYDFGFQDGIPYLVQEFLPGEDLDQLIGRRALTPELKLEYLIQVAAGLEYAHSQGVIHRDIKPSNIRVIGGGRIKIMDFGIAKLANLQSQLTKTGMTLGTAFYLAPEQIRGEEVTVGVDIFSFGVLAYELFAHRRPFDGENLSHLFYQILTVEPPPLRSLDPECPEALAAAIEKCLRKDARERWRSCAEIVAALEPLRGTLRDTLAPGDLPADSAPEPAARAAEMSETVALSASQARRELATVQARVDELLAAGDATAAEIEITLARKRFAAVSGVSKVLDPMNDRIAEQRERTESARRRRDKVQGLVARGRELVAAGELDEARLVARTAIELDPEDPGGRELLERIDQVEADLRARAEADRRQREEEERRRREAEAERQRQAEEAEKRRIAAEAERQRRAEEEERRRREVEAERQRQAEAAEARRLQEEAERRRQAEEEAQRRQERVAAEAAERQRKAEDAQLRKREREAAEEQHRRQAEQERERKEAAEEQRRRQAEEEKQRWAEAQEAARQREQEQRRQREEEKQARRRAEAAANVATLLSAGKVERAEKALATSVAKLGEDPALTGLAEKVAAARVGGGREAAQPASSRHLLRLGVAAGLVVAAAVGFGVWRSASSRPSAPQAAAPPATEAPAAASDRTPELASPMASPKAPPAGEKSPSTNPSESAPQVPPETRAEAAAPVANRNEPNGQLVAAAPTPEKTGIPPVRETRPAQPPAASAAAGHPEPAPVPAPEKNPPAAVVREPAASGPATVPAAGPSPREPETLPAPASSTPPVTSSPAPSPAASTSAPTPTRAEPPAAVDESAAVLAALDRYRRAFESLDAGAVQAVWPAVNAAALRRSFEQDESLSMSLGGCQVSVDGSRATAVCQLEQRIQPKAGEPQHLRRRTRFELRRSGAGWTIQKIQ